VGQIWLLVESWPLRNRAGESDGFFDLWGGTGGFEILALNLAKSMCYPQNVDKFTIL
jgi:hypothetical protein